MSDSLTSMILHFAESAYTRGLNVPPSYNPFTPMLAWNTIYYTIYSTAVLLEDKPLLGPLPMRQNSCLQSLTAFGGTLFVGLIKIKIKWIVIYIKNKPVWGVTFQLVAPPRRKFHMLVKKQYNNNMSRGCPFDSESSSSNQLNALARLDGMRTWRFENSYSYFIFTKLFQIVGWLSNNWSQAGDISDQALYLLSLLLEGSQDGPCLLDMDCFGLLVPLILALPSIFEVKLPTEGTLHNHITLLIFYAQVATVLLTASDDEEVDMETEEADCDAVKEAVVVLRGGYPPQSNVRSWWIVSRNCLPFLRRAALFAHYLQDRTDPGELDEPGGDTFENLCRYIKLFII